jgi:hypothetical protein
MIEFFLLVGIIFIILTFFYKQANHDFRLNQIEWSKRETALDLMHERAPLIIRGIPFVSCWTYNDIVTRTAYDKLKVFKEVSLSEWVTSSRASTECPWRYNQAEQIAHASGIAVWANKWINPMIISVISRGWIYPRYHCWAGNVGLRRTYATWTCIVPIDNEITVAIMPETVENELPTKWIDCFPSQLTLQDTPFVADLKYIDIKLRPGTCLFMPAHWFISWMVVGEKLSTVCTISYHTPISLLAFHASPHIVQ